MKNKMVIIVALVALTLIILAYMYNARMRSRTQTDMMNAQVNLINAQTAQQTACDSSWQCTATQLLTGVGGVIGGFF